MEVKEASSKASLTVIEDSKSPQKIRNSDFDSSKSPKRKYNFSIDPAFLISNIMYPTLKPSLQPDLHRNDYLTFQVSTEKYQFEPQLKSLYMVSTPYKLNKLQTTILIVTSLMCLSSRLHMSTGLQIIKKSSLSEGFFYDLLCSIYILMIRIRISKLLKKTCPS